MGGGTVHFWHILANNVIYGHKFKPFLNEFFLTKIAISRGAESAGSWDLDPRQFSLDMFWQAVLSIFFMRQAVFSHFS